MLLSELPGIFGSVDCRPHWELSYALNVTPGSRQGSYAVARDARWLAGCNLAPFGGWPLFPILTSYVFVQYYAIARTYRQSYHSGKVSRVPVSKPHSVATTLPLGRTTWIDAVAV